MTERLRVTTSDGKYTVIQEEAGNMRFLRHGEPWPAADQFAHVGLILALAQDNEELRSKPQTGPLKLDTLKQVFFYEQEFYVLSNFSAFTLYYQGKYFNTAEAAYHYQKFPEVPGLQQDILMALSAHAALKLAKFYDHRKRSDWDSVRVDVMRDILRKKASQHEYVRRKLLETGDREIVENSWRDDFWGWGPNRDGQNMLGRLWMEIRKELVNGRQ